MKDNQLLLTTTLETPIARYNKFKNKFMNLPAASKRPQKTDMPNSKQEDSRVYIHLLM